MNLDNARTTLKKVFGFDHFRPLQAEIIQAVYDKRDVLVLMPTGGGKSLCFQVPAITMDGTALVVSPLIALMKDQVQGLRANGVAAAYYNSSLDAREARKLEDELLEGKIKILYVSPEKLVSQSFLPLLKRLSISLIAVDEAHCISAWGHDFRPEYTQLRFLRRQFGEVPLLAFTATADKLTRKDILAQLELRDPGIFIASFDRPNISLHVRPGQKRIEQIVEFVKKRSGQSGIIYCLARKSCEMLAEKLNTKGVLAAYYHADMPPGMRSKIQDDFINDRIPIICATIAFGMGIDKSNVRYVLHYNLPRNLEGYYQEVGRAGRDGLPSEALLFFSYGDVQTYRQMFEEGESSDEQKELKIAKLERMFQFAEAPVCRRRTVLNYFGETYEQNCGNCDVCLSPPRQFDGTVAVQKALSALLRTGEKVGMTLLVDVLRGSQRREVLDRGYNQIKTFGAGREYTFDEWLFLLSQMLHHGLVEIAYDEHNNLKVTPMGKAVLLEGKQVALALPATKEKPAAGKSRAVGTQVQSPLQTLRESLFDKLRELRRALAQQHGVPPYLIFSDATLEQMVERRPISDAEMLEISGVSERKLQLYGDAFIQTIRDFVLEKTSEGVKVTGSTYLLSWDLYKKGHTPEEIAGIRNVSPTTVFSHLATMYERGENIDLAQWVSPEEIDIIQGSLGLFHEPFVLKEIFEHFKEKFPYEKIRWSIAAYKRLKKNA